MILPSDKLLSGFQEIFFLQFKNAYVNKCFLPCGASFVSFLIDGLHEDLNLRKNK